MNINSKDIIAGQPILKIGELLKFPGPWTIDYVIEKLKPMNAFFRQQGK